MMKEETQEGLQLNVENPVESEQGVEPAIMEPEGIMETEPPVVGEDGRENRHLDEEATTAADPQPSVQGEVADRQLAQEIPIHPLDVPQVGDNVVGNANPPFIPDERFFNEYPDDNDEEFREVTCFCGMPFAGRPMIECNFCMTWIHLACSGFRLSNLPDVFMCPQCVRANMSFKDTCDPDNNDRKPESCCP